MKYKIFILSFILFGNLLNVGAQGLIHDIKRSFVRTSKSIGGINVKLDNDFLWYDETKPFHFSCAYSRVIVRGVYFTCGVGAINEYSYNGFSFSELDEFVYDMLIYKVLTAGVVVMIYTRSVDAYGHDSISSDPIIIGPISVSDSKKYKNFYYWNKRYNTRREFERAISSGMQKVTF